MDMSSDISHAKDTTRAIVKTKYTCPMHSEVILDKPGKCPKCGMTLVKMKSSPNIKKSHKMQKDTTMSHPDMMH
jgi:transcription initiation factor IIE alpha subunit